MQKHYDCDYDYDRENKIPYSREQKHVSISDTPMLLIEINSISNMGCQINFFEWAEILWGFMIWDFMNPHKISANSEHKQKSFIPKKNRCVTIRDCKNMIFWIVTCVSTRDYTVSFTI